MSLTKKNDRKFLARRNIWSEIDMRICEICGQEKEFAELKRRIAYVSEYKCGDFHPFGSVAYEKPVEYPVCAGCEMLLVGGKDAEIEFKTRDGVKYIRIPKDRKYSWISA